MPSNVSPSGLVTDLISRSDLQGPIRIGLVGCGEMGTDIVSQVQGMQGIEVSAIADLRPEAALAAVRIAQQGEQHAKQARNTAELSTLIEKNQIGVVEDANDLLRCGLIDVVVEATGLPGPGADYALTAMQQGKHVVMMNVEADVTVGAYLNREAKNCGVVYSLGAGDEPSSCMELIDFVSSLGHRIVAAGKGKNNPLNIDAIPDEYEAEATRRNMNPRMLVEFVDGSKTMVEMAAIANATGLVPDKPGMHGPSISREELAKVLVPQSHGGILSDIGRVDFSVGAGVAPGVFVVAEMGHPRIRERMEDLKMGEGPYFSFVRPYHLTSLEVPLTCARAVLYGKADMVPLEKPVAEVCAVAKRDIKAGEKLDQIGEYCYRAWIMEAAEAKQQKAIPCGLLAGAQVSSPIKKGDLITTDTTTPDAQSRIVALRALQDQLPI